MAGIPCPSCKQSIGLTLDFIMKHPKMQCPHCKTVMNFEVSEEIKLKMQKGLREIEEIKKKYSKLAKFS